MKYPSHRQFEGRQEFSWWLQRLLYLAIAALLFGGYLSIVMAGAQTANGAEPAWVMPAAITLQRAGDLSSIPQEPGFLDNLNCTYLTYRLVNSDTMQTGCFTGSAFGLMEGASSRVIFGSTDEAVPIITYTPQQILVPWPNSAAVVTLDSLNTGGALVSLYKNAPVILEDQRNLLGQLTAKRLTAAPDTPLNDAAGNRLVINPQTLTFSDNGSWLVAETVQGSFVRVNLATLDVITFARGYTTSGGPATLPSRIAITDRGRYVAISNDYAREFKIYDLQQCRHTDNTGQPQNCTFYDYRPFIASKIDQLRAIRHVRFINDDLLTFENRASNTASDGTYLLTPAAELKFLSQYLALGDSYTSGEGAYNYVSGTDTENNLCHLSRHSYPMVLTEALFSADGGYSVACSGAIINDIGSTSNAYRGQVGQGKSWQELQENGQQLLASIFANYMPGFVAQYRFVGRLQPSILTVSIGGNDIGFGAMLRQCVAPHLSRHQSDNTCFNTYEDRLEVQQLIDRTRPRLTALYRSLLQQAPGAKIYAIGYPHIAVDTGDCGINVQLTKSELEFAVEVIEYLNKTIRQAAATAGVTYVDISQALAGHRLCEAPSYALAVNGVTAGQDGGPLRLKIFGKESYHPNAFGYSLIAQAILRQTANFTQREAPKTEPPASKSLATGPTTGRQLFARQPATGLAPEFVKPGSPITVQADATVGLKPHTAYSVHFDNPTQPAVGSAISDDRGTLHLAITVPLAMPGNITAGNHTIHITGENQLGETLDVTQPIYVMWSDTDADGDAVPDDLDTCPGAVNSARDDDTDGIDDICDALIGQPPAAGSSPSAAAAGVAGPNSTSNNQSGAGLLPAATATTTYSPTAPAAKYPPIINIEGSRLAISWLLWVVLWFFIWLLLLLFILLLWLIRRRQFMQRQWTAKRAVTWQNCPQAQHAARNFAHLNYNT